MKKTFLALFAIALLASFCAPAIVRLTCASIIRQGVEVNQSAKLFMDSGSGPVATCDQDNMQITVINQTGVVLPLDVIYCSNGIHFFSFTPGVSVNYTFVARLDASVDPSGVTDSCVVNNLSAVPTQIPETNLIIVALTAVFAALIIRKR